MRYEVANCSDRGQYGDNDRRELQRPHRAADQFAQFGAVHLVPLAVAVSGSVTGVDRAYELSQAAALELVPGNVEDRAKGTPEFHHALTLPLESR